jgi:hypothetical protein
VRPPILWTQATDCNGARGTRRRKAGERETFITMLSEGCGPEQRKGRGRARLLASVVSGAPPALPAGESQAVSLRAPWSVLNGGNLSSVRKVHVSKKQQALSSPAEQHGTDAAWLRQLAHCFEFGPSPA